MDNPAASIEEIDNPPPYNNQQGSTVFVIDEVDEKNDKKKTSDVGAFLHLLKSSLGSGILAMPSAFKNGGLIFGTVGTIIAGIICTHCVHLLVYCAQILAVKEKKSSLGFPETAEAAFRNGPERLRKFASFARLCVKAGLFATYYLGNTAYVIFIASTLKQVCDNHFGIGLSIRIYTLLVAIPLIPIGSVSSLRYLVPFSFLATILVIGGLVTTLYFTFMDLPPIETAAYIGEPGHLPLFFATVLFAMEGIGTVLPIENSMKNPNHFIGCTGILNPAMAIVTTLFTVVGFFGYLKFGDKTMGSITLNLGETKSAEAVKVIVALSILLTYSLQFTVPTEILWKWMSKKIREERHTLGYYTMRVLMICGTIIIAVLVPDLSPFISLVGAVCFSLLGLLFPCLIEMATISESGFGILKWRLVKDIIISVLSIVALVSGGYASILEIIAMYQNESKQ